MLPETAGLTASPPRGYTFKATRNGVKNARPQGTLRCSTREPFKDEVRKLGVELGLPRAMVYRHPFPGPGLVVRILGEVRKDYADLLRQADAIFIEELRRHDLYDKTSQTFAVFTSAAVVKLKVFRGTNPYSISSTDPNRL